MLNAIKNWQGSISVNGIESTEINDIDNIINSTDRVSILLYPKESAHISQISTDKAIEYKVTVKAYMTKKATADFDFMDKWNNGIPMPLRVMVGTKEKETKGMVYMKLHGDILDKITPVCMKCGKPLTNPVSQFFGIGPECGGHNYVNPFSTDEELQSAVKVYKEKLRNITWEGWIIKSAIQEIVEI